MKTLTCQCHRTLPVKKGASIICPDCDRCYGISCAQCTEPILWAPGKRVVCLHCGADFGMPIERGEDGKVHLTCSPNPRPAICHKIEAGFATAEHMVAEYDS
jgi:hypothetical protein